MPAPDTVPYHPLDVDDPEAIGESILSEYATRRSVRDFSDRPVPKRLIELAIEAASTAPSGAHRQPWTFVLIGDPAMKQRIRDAAEAEERENYLGGRMNEEWQAALEPLGTDWRKPFLETVPWIVVVFEQRYGLDEAGERVHHYYVKESVGIATGLFLTALHRMGLASLTHTPSPMRFLSDLLGRPENERPFVLIPIGYPADDCRVPDLVRKRLEDVMVEVPAPHCGRMPVYLPFISPP